MENVAAHYNRLASYEWERLAQDPYHSLIGLGDGRLAVHGQSDEAADVL